MKTKIQKFKLVFFGLLVGGIILFGIFSIIQNISLKKSLSDLTTLETGQEQSDVQKMGFYGNIKSDYEFSYYAIEILGFVFRGKQSGLIGNEYSSELLYFDKYGKITESINYRDNWIFTTKYHYYSNDIKKEENSEHKEYFGDQKNESTSQYDLKGNLISNVFESSNGNKHIYKYDYDKHERLIELRESHSGSNLYSQKYSRLTQYHYSLEGDIIKEVVYNNENGSLISNKDYKYNEKEYLVEINEFNYVNSSPWLITTYDYDYENRVLSKIVKDLYFEPAMDDSLFVYSYDSEGNLMQEDQFKFYDHKPYKVNTFHYNIKGNVIYEGYYDSNGGFISDYNYKYDNDGRLIETIIREIKDSKESIKKIIYKYKLKKGFKNDTWFKKIYYTDDKPENIVIRKLEFY